MIIGLTGTFASGKDTIADYLEKQRNFEHYATSGVIREVAAERGIEPTRDNLRELGNALRDEHGFAFLPRTIIEKKARTDRVIVSGLRQPDEVSYLRSLGNFYLIAVDAPIELRFKRMQARHRSGDPKDIDEMRDKERKEMGGVGNSQSIRECMKMADYEIVNDGTLEDLHHKIEAIYEKIECGK